MTCPACDGPIERGKVLLCLACFNALPRVEQIRLRSHYLRICQVCKNPAAIANGMRDKMAKVVRLVRESRAPAPISSGPVGADTVEVIHLGVVRADNSTP